MLVYYLMLVAFGTHRRHGLKDHVVISPSSLFRTICNSLAVNYLEFEILNFFLENINLRSIINKHL